MTNERVLHLSKELYLGNKIVSSILFELNVYYVLS